MNPNRNKNVKHNEVGKSATAGCKNLGRDQCPVYSSTLLMQWIMHKPNTQIHKYKYTNTYYPSTDQHCQCILLYSAVIF